MNDGFKWLHKNRNVPEKDVYWLSNVENDTNVVYKVVQNPTNHLESDKCV